MSEQICISVIIPFYNAEKHINNCISSLLAQDFKKSFEIIMVDDASNDESKNIIRTYNIPFLKLLSLQSNSGQSTARNLGIENAEGKYIFFMDVDDLISQDTFSTLFNIAEKDDCDLVFSDFKRIENSKNQRENTYNYPDNQLFENEKILDSMQDELYNHNPLFGHLGLFGCNGRLIKRSILHNNKIKFIEELRYLDDKTFGWDVLGYVQKAKYIKKQLYSYHVYPNVSTAVIDGVNRGFPIDNFKLAKSHIQQSLRKRGLSEDKIKKCGNQALIFFIITLLVSYSRCIILGKVESYKGKANRRKIISEIINDPTITKAARNYTISKQESFWIPKAIFLRSQFFLEFACDIRANQTIKMRRKGKS
tara:strand:- start:19 stop:1113 length:1095 start_codon:yes stop_codon:yes gene_type:complete